MSATNEVRDRCERMKAEHDALMADVDVVVRDNVVLVAKVKDMEERMKKAKRVNDAFKKSVCDIETKNALLRVKIKSVEATNQALQTQLKQAQDECQRLITMSNWSAEKRRKITVELLAEEDDERTAGDRCVVCLSGQLVTQFSNKPLEKLRCNMQCTDIVMCASCVQTSRDQACFICRRPGSRMFRSSDGPLIDMTAV